MSVNTLVKDGLLINIDEPVTILKLKTGKEVDYNPGLARDDQGKTWISIRSCVIKPDRPDTYNHPNHYQNFLFVGLLDEATLTVKQLKEVVPEKEYPGFQWGIEDIRLFWRDDGLHGIGVAIPIIEGVYSIRQVEILINHKAGTYKLIKDHGRPLGHIEKNWSPTEHPNPNFDFAYSPTQYVKDGKVYGTPNELFIHNGTPLIEYEDGYLSIGHSVVAVLGQRTYAQIALRWDKQGILAQHSQFFHFNVGWREKLKETIEFASGLLWVKGEEGKTLLVGLGVKDELTGLCKLPVSKLEWHDYSDTMWYAWRWVGEPNRVELIA